MDFPSLLPAALGSVVKACRSVKRYVVAIFRVFVFVKLGTALQNSADRSCPDGSGGEYRRRPCANRRFTFLASFPA